jgi:hypothetical protein
MSARFTVRLDEDLMRLLRERAERNNTSLTQVINDVIRVGLRTKPKRKRFVQKTYDMGKPLVDLTHLNTLLDEWDTEEFIRKMSQGQ